MSLIFDKKYQLVSSDKFDEYMKALGKSFRSHFPWPTTFFNRTVMYYDFNGILVLGLVKRPIKKKNKRNN